MSKLEKALEQYLALRRALGFQLGRTETRLRQFLAFLEGKRTTRITTALAHHATLRRPNAAPRSRPLA